jgi:hypothetical protein
MAKNEEMQMKRHRVEGETIETACHMNHQNSFCEENIWRIEAGYDSQLRLSTGCLTHQ